MKKINKFLLALTLIIFSNSYAQLTIDVQLRPRFEYRHGYKTLFPDNVDAASFVSQRTRLNAGFKISKLDFYLSFQDVRVWGDVPQLNTEDKYGLTMHQAWGEIQFTPEISSKLGRQEIVYDDHRMMGNVGWAQQARSHDAAILKYQKNTFKGHLGYAFNQDDEALTGHLLNGNTYKSLFYTWLHNDWNNLGVSLLYINNGLQFNDEENPETNETRFSHTAGSHLTFKKEKLSATVNLFYQFGNDKANNDLNAYLLGFEANYEVSRAIMVGLGVELQSGNDNGNIVNQENNAFTPLYGTNHKFNGFIDYFYVGNHADDVGLLDVYAKAKIGVTNKAKFDLVLHNFSAAADITSSDSKQLGTELDLGYSYQFIKEVNIQAGYSHMFPSPGLELLKNNFDNNTNNWAWVMVTIDPILFNSKTKK